MTPTELGEGHPVIILISYANLLKISDYILHVSITLHLMIRMDEHLFKININQGQIVKHRNTKSGIEQDADRIVLIQSLH